MNPLLMGLYAGFACVEADSIKQKICRHCAYLVREGALGIILSTNLYVGRIFQYPRPDSLCQTQNQVLCSLYWCNPVLLWNVINCRGILHWFMGSVPMNLDAVLWPSPVHFSEVKYVHFKGWFVTVELVDALLVYC